MKNKILFGICTVLLVFILTSFFLPIDATYIYAINFLLGFLSFALIFVTFFVKKEIRFLILSSIQLVLLFLWYVLVIKYHSNIYGTGFKLYVYLLIIPISLSEFILANQFIKRRRFLLGCYLFLQICVFIKILLFTPFYKIAGYGVNGEDIRNYSKKQYKVLNPHKLLNKNPEKLSEEDYKAIYSLINDSDWIKDNYSEVNLEYLKEIDILKIKNDIKYSFSTIHFNGLEKVDFYKISISLQSDIITIYFPKGTFYLSKDDLELYKKYYNVLPNETDYYLIYEGVGLPYNQEKYASYINNYYNWKN